MNHPSDDTKTNKSTSGGTALALPNLANLGIGQVAYIRQVEVHGQPAYAVHGADGQPLVVTTDREVAFAMARQNNLEPLSVH